jgi:hypothetical protein
MAPLVACRWIPRKILIASACALACACMQTPPAAAQRGHTGGVHAGASGHFSGGVRVAPPRVFARPASAATMARPQIRFRQGPVLTRRRIFVRAPFFRFRGGFRSWWLMCGPVWNWEANCNDLLVYENGLENYVTLPEPVYQNPPEYLYYGGDHELVELFLKDGTVYGVTDYWFVSGQVHFTMLVEGGTKSIEQTIGLDELDLQKTIDVNTRRGFRVVMRNEPLEQYLRDHPDATAPLLTPPPEKK